ncbi:hypothetical protein VPNG_06999 [Cytospora leucostoma]|uniref:Rhodopsin domain-containing protein n=1 Tax=Cytospora leucostoma TaxID=1230097 RepID=A0A423WNC4_9PEZI|nr:hypothetical protein VPNG_06999 [Cytospora leucostoma]
MDVLTIHGTPPPDAQSLRTFAYAATTIVLLLSTSTLALRLFARVKLQSGLELDDYLMIAGYVTYFALQRANQIALALIKCSILVFYMRIFVTRPFKIAAWVLITLTLIWAIVTWCINLTVCTPVSYFWDKTIPGGKCASQQVTGAVSGALGALGDVLILGLPLFMLRGLKLNQRKKVALSAIFLLGAFTCAASIIRIVEVIKAVPTDLPYTNAESSTWTAMEMEVAIFSGNLPSLAPLFGHFFRNKKGTKPPSYPDVSGQSLSTTGQRGARSRHNRKSIHLTDTDGFERISDDLYAQSKRESLCDMEMGDRAILVRTEFGYSTEARNHTAGPDAYEMQVLPAQQHVVEPT